MELPSMMQARDALMNRIVDQLAVEQGLDKTPGFRGQIVHEARLIAYDYVVRRLTGEELQPAGVIGTLLAELFELDRAISKTARGTQDTEQTLH